MSLSCHRQIYQNFEKPPQRLQNSDFRCHFQHKKSIDFFSVQILRPTFIIEKL